MTEIEQYADQYGLKWLHLNGFVYTKHLPYDTRGQWGMKYGCSPPCGFLHNPNTKQWVYFSWVECMDGSWIYGEGGRRIFIGYELSRDVEIFESWVASLDDEKRKDLERPNFERFAAEWAKLGATVDTKSSGNLKIINIKFE